eukprot:268116_1
MESHNSNVDGDFQGRASTRNRRMSFSQASIVSTMDKSEVERRMMRRPSVYPEYHLEHAKPDTTAQVHVDSIATLGRKHVTRKKHEQFRMTEWPSSLRKCQWSTEDIVQRLRDQVTANAPRKDHQYQQILVRFKNAQIIKSQDSSSVDLKPAGFLHLLHDFNLFVSREQSNDVFKFFDTSGDGTVTIREFFLKLVEDDYPDATEERLMHSKHNVHYSHTIENYQRRLRMWKDHYAKSQHNLLLELQNKINQRISRCDDRFRQIYKVFGNVLNDDNTGVEFEGLKQMILDFGIPVSDEECYELFEVLDVEQTGLITFDTFVQAIMPDDYPTSKAEFDSNERFADPTGLSTRLKKPQKPRKFIAEVFTNKNGEMSPTASRKRQFSLQRQLSAGAGDEQIPAGLASNRMISSKYIVGPHGYMSPDY